MRYGDLPKRIGNYKVECKEMMLYQYLPIKMIGSHKPITEQRLRCFAEIIGVVCCDFIGVFGLDRYINSYVYLTAKRGYQKNNCPFNRQGYHSDGFLTNDINYIWCDKNPTVFNSSNFNISKDDTISLKEMEEQALKENEITYPENELLRLDQFNIHKVAEVFNPGMRTFIKISFSSDKYDLVGNSHNYLINYNWEMKERKVERNIPQSVIK